MFSNGTVGSTAAKTLSYYGPLGTSAISLARKPISLASRGIFIPGISLELKPRIKTLSITEAPINQAVALINSQRSLIKR